MGKQVSEVEKMALSIKNGSGKVNVTINQPNTSEKQTTTTVKVTKGISIISNVFKVIDVLVNLF